MSAKKTGLDDFFVAGGSIDALVAGAIPFGECRESLNKNVGAEAVYRDRVMTLAELYEAEYEPTAWVVDGLLPTGSLCLLSAKPKVGKSTLARDLCRCVALGVPFLGRQVKAGSVVYFAMEEKESEVRAHFERMGVGSGADIRMVFGSCLDVGASILAVAVADAKPTLVVIDPIMKMLPVKDSSDYSEVTKVFAPVLDSCRVSGACVLAAHHSKKGMGAGNDLDEVLGSTGIAGGVDNVILLSKDIERNRRIATVQRYGDEMEPTKLVLENNGTCSLGATISREKSEAITEEVVKFVGANPDCDLKQIKDAVSGNSAKIGECVSAMIERGELVRVGSGKRGDAFKYSIPDSSYIRAESRIELPDAPKSDSFNSSDSDNLFDSSGSNDEGGIEF